MSLSGIRYHSPQSLEEALKLLEELQDARVVAGGTDLLVDIKQGLLGVKNLISLQKIEELKGIEKKNGFIRIGALATPQEIISSSPVNKYIPALAEAARSMASPQIRSMATIGGNIASAVPSADLPPPLIAAEATVELRCTESSRQIFLSEFFTGPRETVCLNNELLTSITIPLLPSHTGISFEKFALREANALAVASVTSRLTLFRGKISKAAIVLGAVAPFPLLARKASEILSGREPSDTLFEEAASFAREEARPISDLRGSAWFRRELIQVLTRRTLKEALHRAQGKSKKGN